MSLLPGRRSGPSFANPWVIVGLVTQLGAALASTYGFFVLLLPIALLMGLCCLIGGGDWAIRGRTVGLVLVAIGIGSPIFMLWYPRHLGHFARDHIADYRAAVPVVLAADAAHCKHSPDRFFDSCEVRDLLPPQLRSLGRSIRVQYSDAQPVVFFQLVHDRHGLMVYAPGWPEQPRSGSIYRSLGDGWHTSLPQ